MTTTQRDAIAAPAVGLVIYNTTSNCLNFYAGSTWHETCGTIPPSIGNYPPGSVFCALGAAAVVDVTNPTTGKTWMDRNLGATQVATGSTDADSYGDLYQWGRLKDGHQCRTSSTTSTNSSDDTPGDALFILETVVPYNWRSTQNDNLWQGVDGTNNPCPGGYRLPTSTELDNERNSWGSNNSAGAFGSVLKLPMPGYRSYSDGSFLGVGTDALYWSSTVNGAYVWDLYVNSSNVQFDSNPQGYGSSVRCLKDYNI